MAIYRERLTPNLGIHIALLLLIPMGFGMLAPINIAWGVANAIALYVLAVLWFTVGAPVVEVSADTLRAGRAVIARTHVGAVTIVERAERRDALSNARAWIVIRAWIPRGVRIDIVDDADPTPYWYVSTRNPERLVAALERS